MDAKLTYIFFLSFVACLVSSCTSDAPANEDSDKANELSFTVSGLSRASVTTDINTPGAKFAVYGDRSFVDTQNESPVVVFNNTEVEYTDGSWRYDNIQYWFIKHEHSFVAVYPSSVVGTDNSPRYADSKLSFTLTVPTSSAGEIDRSDVVDILGATHRRYYYMGDALPVSFSFSHLMSLINIAPALNDNIMPEDAYLQFHKLEVTGLRNKATFSILPAPRQSATQTDDREIEVTNQEGEAKLTFEFANPPKIINHAANVALFDPNDAIIMLPQDFAADSQAKIILTYTLNGSADTMQLSSPLSSLVWESGKSYTYKLTLNRSGLVLSSTQITDWDKADAGNVDAH